MSVSPAPARTPFEERFWAGFARIGECLEWQRARDHRGYGRVGRGTKVFLTHRMAWELTNGPIPEGTHVLHRCDNPPCGEPSHLFLGTDLDNMRDMWDKGRGAPGLVRGQDNGMAILTEDQVREIRRRYVPRKVTLHALAAEYGVTYSTIGYIISRKLWKHVE